MLEVQDTVSRAANKQVRQATDREYRRRLRAKLTAIRQQIKQIQKARSRGLVQARTICTASNRRLKERIAQYRKAERDRTNQEIATWRKAARAKCQENKQQIRKSTLSAERKARALLEEERRYTDLILRTERKKPPPRSSAKERREESDDRVLANIDPDLAPVFEEVKRSIKNIPGASRTEVFLQWVEENPEDVQALQAAGGEAAADAQIKELAKAERQVMAKLRKGKLSIRDLERVGISCRDVQAAGLSCDDPHDLAAFMTEPAEQGLEALPF